MKLRIGIDACCWSNRRGFGRFTRELLQAVVATDPGTEYVFFADRDTARASQFPDRAQVVVADTKVAPTEAASASGRRSVGDLWALTRQVRRHKLDLFFFPAVYSYFPILNRTRIIVTIHDMIADHNPAQVFPNWRSKLFWKLKQNLALRQSDLVLTVSEYSKQGIKRYFNLPEARIQAISEGPSTDFGVREPGEAMTEVLGRYQLALGQRFLLYVGGISPHKNLKALVDAFSMLLREPGGGDLKLVLVGDYQGDSFHSDYPALKQHIEKQGLTGRVIFTGYIPDRELTCLYNAATLLAFPSLEEGFGLPAVEAMACGTPVVASNCGSLPEIVGDAGRFFDPRRTETIFHSLRDVIQDASLRKEMRERGLKRSQLFTWEAVGRKTARIFAEVAGRERRHG